MSKNGHDAQAKARNTESSARQSNDRQRDEAHAGLGMAGHQAQDTQARLWALRCVQVERQIDASLRG